MQFVLTGFKHEAGLRVFEFQGIAADKTRSNFFVSADLRLLRRYGIQVQELPLLCIRLLEKHDFARQEHTVTYEEEEMRQHMNRCIAERDAAQKKKNVRRNIPTEGQKQIQVFPVASRYGATESVSPEKA